MKCPQCNSLNVRKNGHQQGKQRFECKDCGRIFRESHELRGVAEFAVDQLAKGITPNLK